MSDPESKDKPAQEKATLDKPEKQDAQEKPKDDKPKWFQSDVSKLQHVFDPKNKPSLDEYGGLERILTEFRVDPAVGLHEDEDRDLVWTDESTGQIHGPQV